jgi:hypothetical protein
MKRVSSESKGKSFWIGNMFLFVREKDSSIKWDKKQRGKKP